MKSVVAGNLLGLGLLMLGLIGTQPAQSQSITAAKDGTGTVVNTSGNRISISGGTLSSDRANLFHSFQQFGLNANQIANFISNPQIQNILARVVGGSPSTINGLLQVTGGNSNLFIVNPAGIVFGANASLNVPASFTATTANGVGFGSKWLSASGPNSYANLVGNPSSFAFTMSQPGAIVNAGNLAVGQGENLTLVGGTVVSTGQLSAPGGQITVAAVPGEHVLRISQAANPLSLEIQPLDAVGNRLPASWTTPIRSLPQLLTGGGGGNATGLTVNSDGTVQLTGSGIQIATDTGGTTVSGQVNVAATQSGQQGGTVNLLGDRVGLFGATVNASGASGGGTVRIGGDYQGSGTVPNASRTYISSDSTINADALQSGNGGKVIVWADQATDFSGSISARGGANSGNGGFVEVSGKDSLTFQGTVDTSAAYGSLGTLLLDPTNILVKAGNGNGNVPVNGTGQFVGNPAAPVPGSILFGDLNGMNPQTATLYQSQLEGLAGNTNLILQASNDIRIQPLANGTLNLRSGTGSVAFLAGDCGPTCTTGTTGSFYMNPTDTILAPGRNITISAAAPFPVGGLNGNATAAIVVGNINTSSNTGNSGSVTLSANTLPGYNKNIQAGNIITLSTAGNGGAVTLNAYTGGGPIQGNIQVGTIDSRSIAGGAGGNITLSTKNSSSAKSTITTTGDINSGGVSGGGNINFQGKVVLASANSNFDAGDGNITFSNTVNGQAGAQNLTLNSGQDGISFGAAVGNTQPLGNITLTGNQLNLAAKVFGTGTLTLQPGTPNQNIAVGNTVASTNPNTLDLTSAKLALFQPGFQQVQIGRQDGTGTVTLYNSVANGGATPFNSPVNIAGGATLVGPTLVNVWNITGANSGDINGSFSNGLTFNNIKNLTAGSATDSFIFQTGSSISGNITGIGNTNTIDYSKYGSPVTVNLAAKTTTGTAGIITGSFTNIGNIVGSSTGANTLVGANTANNWNITQNNTGNINGTLAFTNFQNLTGGSISDTFKITPKAGVSGNISGRSSATALDYSAYTTPVTVDLGTGKATNVGGTISNITKITGGTGNNTLTGPNTNNTWNITSNNSGTINSNSFSNFQNLTGGSGDDTFKINSGVNITGIVDGGGGFNSLDYSAYSQPFKVNLKAGTATATGGIVNIQAPDTTETTVPSTGGSAPSQETPSGNSTASSSLGTSAVNFATTVSRNSSQPNDSAEQNSATPQQQPISIDLQGRTLPPVLVQDQQKVTSILCLDESLAHQMPGQKKVPVCPVKESQRTPQ